MAKNYYLASNFMLGIFLSSFLGSIPKIESSLIPVAAVLYTLVSCGWVVLWLCDDAVVKYLKVSASQYYALLLGFGVAVAIGGITQWLLG